MTIPGVPTHKHISEREADGTWEDCTWDAGLEFYRDAVDPSVPATHAEAQELRKASGEPPTGGSNMGDFRRGVKNRYHDDLPPAINAHNILSALKPNMCATVQGSMKAFGSTHRLSKYDRNFDGSHDVYIANVGGKLYWCDPEAPTTADVPVIVSPAEVQAFVNAFGGEAIVAPIQSLQKESTVDLKTYTPGATANVKPESNVRDQPHITATKLHATTAKLPVGVIGTVIGDVDPANGSNIWYALWHENRVEYTAKDNVVDLKPAPSATPAYPDLSAELAAANAQTKSAQAAETAAKTAAVTAKQEGRAEQYNAIKTAIENGLPRL
jgi:hypothetical protein